MASRALIDRPQVLGIADIDRYLRPDGAAKQFLHAADQVDDVGRLGIECLAAGEGQQALRQRGGTAAGTLRRGDEAAKVVEASPVDADLDELQIAHHAGQEVVEVVRQPAGQLADRLHLLTLAQHLLAVLLLGDVAADREEQRAARRIVRHRGPCERDRRPVGLEQANVELMDGLAAHQGRDHLRCGR
jgi:hypothetical protein